MTSKHGGPRPATKPTDGRHNNKHGSPGRQPKSLTLKLGDTFYVARADADGNGIEPAEVWTVSEIKRTHVKFHSNNGDSIRLIR